MGVKSAEALLIEREKTRRARIDFALSGFECFKIIWWEKALLRWLVSKLKSKWTARKGVRKRRSSFCEVEFADGSKNGRKRVDEKMINIELKLAQTVNEGLLDDVNVVSVG